MTELFALSQVTICVFKETYSDAGGGDGGDSDICTHPSSAFEYFVFRFQVKWKSSNSFLDSHQRQHV
jgi:hypothetical protein